MNIPSDTVKAAQRLLAERERVGLAKYGTTVDRTDLSPEQWLTHMRDELSDGLLYAMRTLQTLRDRRSGPAPEFIVSPIVCPGTPDAHTLTLKIGAQSFRINGHVDFDTREEAAWMADQLLRALANMQQPPMPVTAFNLYTSPQQPDAAYLARWANAPAEATHLAQELDGMCHWFSSCPQQGISGYWHGEPLAVAEPNLLGSVRCEPRPEVQS